MAKKKEFESTISVTEMDKYIKESAQKAKEIDAGDMKIFVKPYITLSEYAEVVTVVSDCSFGEDEDTGEVVYQPYFKDFLTDAEIISKYTNISLPTALIHQYEIVCALRSNGIMERIYEAIDEEQLNGLRRDIYDMINYKMAEKDRDANEAIVYIGERLRALALSAHEVLNKIDGLSDVLSDNDAVKEILSSIQDIANAEEADAVKYVDGDRVIPIPDVK